MNKLLNPLAAVVAGMLLTVAPAAAAQGEAPIVESRGTLSLAVPGADLDFATPAGEAAMRERVAAAIDRLCGAPLPGDYVRSYTPRSHKRCEVLTAEATEPQLMQLFERRGEVRVSSLKLVREFAAR